MCQLGECCSYGFAPYDVDICEEEIVTSGEDVMCNFEFVLSEGVEAFGTELCGVKRGSGKR